MHVDKTGFGDMLCGDPKITLIHSPYKTSFIFRANYTTIPFRFTARTSVKIALRDQCIGGMYCVQHKKDFEYF